MKRNIERQIGENISLARNTSSEELNRLFSSRVIIKDKSHSVMSFLENNFLCLFNEKN